MKNTVNFYVHHCVVNQFVCSTKVFENHCKKWRTYVKLGNEKPLNEKEKLVYFAS